MKEVLLMSGVKIAEKIKKGELSSVEVVQAHIDQIKKVNTLLNAVVKDRFDEALEEAQKADKLVKEKAPEELPPYLGVPCTIKETFFVKGMPNTGGVYYRSGFVADRDATVVKRLREAGCIIMGITNVPELAMWVECYNKVYGRTNNPYDLRRIPGGSSGGEGAIIGAGGSPFGVGSDLGGSIRMPAFFNGIFGHKPSSRLLPNTGQWPLPEGKALTFVSPGPMCRRAADLFPLLKIMAGPDGEDPYCDEIELKTPESVDLSRVRVISVPDNGYIKVSPDLVEAQKKAAEYLRSVGLKVEEKRIPLLKKSLLIYGVMLEEASDISFSELMARGGKFPVFRELLKWVFRASKHTFPAIMLCLIERFPALAGKRAEKFLKKGKELRKILTEEIGPDGVMLFPPYPSPAPKHYRPLFKPFQWVYTGIINVMGFPATAVPLGLNRQGLPLGVQVVGIHGNDHLTIRVAMELERAFGGWRPPEIAEIN